MPGGSYYNTHTKDGKKKKGRHLGSGASKPKKKSKKQAVSEAKARAAVAKANVAVAKAVSTTKPSKMKKGYYSKQLLGSRADGKVLTTEERDQLREVRKLNKEYEEKSTVSKVLLPPPGVAAGDAPFIGSLKSGSNVVGAIKNIVTKGGSKKAAVKAAQAGTAKGAPKAAAKGAAVPVKGEQAAAKMNKAIAKAAQKAKPKSVRAKEFAKSREIATKAGWQAKVRRTANKLAWTGASAPIAGAVGGGIVYNTGKALKDDPGKTLETTAQSLPSLVTAPIGDAKAILSGNPEEVVKEYQNYYDLLNQISDPGNPEAAKIIKNQTGLTPALTIGLMAYGGGRGAYGKRPPTNKGISMREAKLIDKARSGDAKAQAKLAGKRTPLANRKARKTVAQESQRASDMGEAMAATDLKTGGLGRHVRGGGKKVADVVTGEVDGRPIIKKVRASDAVATLGRFPVALDKTKGLAQVRELIARMEKSRGPEDVTNPAVLSDLDVLRALEQNPSLLENKSLRKALEARSRSAPENSRTRAVLAGEDGSQPLKADERAQYLPMARQLDVNTPEERVPKALEGVTSVRAKAGQNAKAAIRAEARAIIRQANKIEVKAKALKDDGMLAEAGALRATGKQMLGEVNKLRRADAMTKLANRIESGQSVPKRYRDLSPDELREAAQVLRDDAQKLVREHMDTDSGLQREFVGEVKGALEQGGYRDPFYVKTGDAREYPSVPGNDGKVHADQTAREKMSTGYLAERGMNQAGAEPFLKGIVEQRIQQAQTMFARSVLENPALTQLGPDGQPLIYTSDQFAKSLQNGEIPPGYTKMSLQEMAKHFQKGTWEEAAGELDSPFHRALREARGLEGNKYFAVRQGAKKEFEAQGKELGLGWKGLRVLGGAQSIALLATSPAWFVYQLAASPMLMFARHPDFIVQLPSVAKRMVARYRSVDKQTRDVFNGMVGAGSSNIFENLSGVPGISSNKKIVSKMADAQALARSTWAGRIVHGLAGNLKRGGPLMAANRKYEAVIRQIDAMLEIDKLIRQERRPEIHRFGKSVSQLDDYTGDLIAQLRGKSQLEVEQFFVRNGTARRELGRRVDDALGNWNALTSNEKRAATALIFYPFLRFSLRWTAFAFPKNNPIKMSVLANIAQINTIEMEKMNGEEDLGFFSDYGKVHVPGSNEVLNLGRIAPASNAYVEAGMGERPPIQSALAGTQPIIGSIVSAMEGVDPFTGRPLVGDDAINNVGDFAAAVGKDMASLSPLARPVVEPASPYSTLLRTVRGNSTNDLAAQLRPQISIPADREMEAQRLGRLMDTAFEELKDDNGYMVSKSSIAFMPAGSEKLKWIRRYNEKVSAAKELAQQFEKYGLEPPEALTTKSYIDFPVGGENETTREYPNREVYLDPKKKKRFEKSPRRYISGDSGADPLGIYSDDLSDPLGVNSSATDDPLGIR